jgi:hypothetical protein
MATTTSPTTDGPAFREVQTGFLVLRLVTEVRSDGLAVRIAPFQRSFRTESFDGIESVDVATYDASEHGGWHWGVRVGPTGNTSYRLSGGDGVRLELADGETLFVGSQRPAELAAAIERRL